MNLAGEITTARERLARACETFGPEGADALEILRDSDQLHVDLHDTIVRARLVPLGPTFRQQIRTLRDAAARTGKQAELTLAGEDVFVDTSLIESVRESLVHLIRNAVDHGIEAPHEREKAGKAPCGSIAIRATRRGGNIVIEVEDDGGGLDRTAILNRAKERGLVTGDVDLVPAEIDRLLFAPGFTTSSAITDLSGRGVGLDVVRRRIEALGGTVHIESAPGVGTTITLRVPLTVAIIDAYHVLAGDHHYVIPADAVIECREWSTGSPNHAFTQRDGSALPCVRLSSVLGAVAATPPREELIVVDHDGVTAGLVVDAILGSSLTVVKPLGLLLQRPTWVGRLHGPRRRAGRTDPRRCGRPQSMPHAFRDTPVTTSLLSFELAGERFAIDFASVRAVVEASAPCRLPETPDFLLGIVPSPVGSVPLVDLSRKFRLSESRPRRPHHRRRRRDAASMEWPRSWESPWVIPARSSRLPPRISSLPHPSARDCAPSSFVAWLL